MVLNPLKIKEKDSKRIQKSVAKGYYTEPSFNLFEGRITLLEV
jgi:hypothetical protein